MPAAGAIPLADKVHDGDRWIARARLGLPTASHDQIFADAPNLSHGGQTAAGRSVAAFDIAPRSAICGSDFGPEEVVVRVDGMAIAAVQGWFELDLRWVIGPTSRREESQPWSDVPTGSVGSRPRGRW